ncbi:MAG: pimeloyl-CoA dehydrogenase large subunit [Pelagibacterales bacterium]|nr:pimeloyl-CoA dehydrogenase large subunit [Pelagibacterales bacterium]
MNLNYTEADNKFRKEIKDFIRDNLSQEAQKRVSNGGKYTKDEIIKWQKDLFKAGKFAYNWPKEYGGCNWTPMQRYIFDQETAFANTPQIVPFGVTMVGPVIIEFGTKKQKEKFLPKILNSEHWWCQGYSEPGSGSDLASLQTKALSDGNNYIINGTKTWTTLAQYADWMFCLVRTNTEAKPQEGISFLLIDMNTKGIKVEPIITLDDSHEINTVYLEDVVVPKENLIYQENKGWTVAKYLLSHERTSIAQVARSKSAIKKLKYIASQETYDNKPLISNIRFRDKLTELEMDMHALEYSELRILSEEAKGTAPGPEASFLKIRGSELQQKISELTLEAVGYFGLLKTNESQTEKSNEYFPGPEYATNTGADYLNLRKTTIYGGSNEIQKNILSKMVLGL